MAEYIGGMRSYSKSVISSEAKILLEFFSKELITNDDTCKGGFLLHARQTSTYTKYLLKFAL